MRPVRAFQAIGSPTHPDLTQRIFELDYPLSRHGSRPNTDPVGRSFALLTQDNNHDGAEYDLLRDPFGSSKTILLAERFGFACFGQSCLHWLVQKIRLRPHIWKPGASYVDGL